MRLRAGRLFRRRRSRGQNVLETLTVLKAVLPAIQCRSSTGGEQDEVHNLRLNDQKYDRNQISFLLDKGMDRYLRIGMDHIQCGERKRVQLAPWCSQDGVEHMVHPLVGHDNPAAR